MINALPEINGMLQERIENRLLWLGSAGEGLSSSCFRIDWLSHAMAKNMPELKTKAEGLMHSRNA